MYIEERISDIENKIEKTCKDEKLEYGWAKNQFPIVATITNDREAVNQEVMDLGDSGASMLPSEGELKFIFDEELQIRIDDDFEISDEIFSKLKNLFRKLHYEQLQLFFKIYKEQYHD